MLNKIATGMNANVDSKLNKSASNLIKYDKNHKTNFNKIDEKNNLYKI